MSHASVVCGAIWLKTAPGRNTAPATPAFAHKALCSAATFDTWAQAEPVLSRRTIQIGHAPIPNTHTHIGMLRAGRRRATARM